MSATSVLETPSVLPAEDHDTTIPARVEQHEATPGMGASSPLSGPQQSEFSAADAAELAARRAAQAKLEARLRGWKPLAIWYAVWASLIGIGAISSLAAGQVGAFFIAATLCAASVKYTHYLYNGGRRRVWFFIW